MTLIPLSPAEPVKPTWSRSQTLEAQALGSGIGALIDQHQDLLVNYLAKLVGNRDRAQDLAQETFLRFWENRERYREEGSLKAYLLRIGTNLVRDEERRRRRWHQILPFFGSSGHSVEDEPVEAKTSEPDPLAQALGREAQAAVQAALAELELSFRAPLVLREIEGMSYQEIADSLQCREGTIKSRLHRARGLLKERLLPLLEGAKR